MITPQQSRRTITGSEVSPCRKLLSERIAEARLPSIASTFLTVSKRYIEPSLGFVKSAIVFVCSTADKTVLVSQQILTVSVATSERGIAMIFPIVKAGVRCAVQASASVYNSPYMATWIDRASPYVNAGIARAELIVDKARSVPLFHDALVKTEAISSQALNHVKHTLFDMSEGEQQEEDEGELIPHKEQTQQHKTTTLRNKPVDVLGQD